jgi:hypothetical protein
MSADNASDVSGPVATITGESDVEAGIASISPRSIVISGCASIASVTPAGNR